MIARTIAIPLSCYPYSSTSRIVHWLTRHHGKVSTLLKGALRPKSPFLGEYDLFSTSELLYYEKRVHALHTAKECAMLHRRDNFRTDWRAMKAVSYLSALFERTTPDASPQPGLFELYEELLDLAETYGDRPQFLVWAELRFCDHQGHAPNLKACVLCDSSSRLRFCASQGGVVCADCARSRKLPMLECPAAVLDALRACQQADHPEDAPAMAPGEDIPDPLNAIMSTFMMYQFGLPTELRTAATAS